MTKLRFSEVFYSIQGEGLHIGKPSVFVRLSGCNLRCAWPCDTPYSLDGRKGIRMSPHNLMVHIAESGWFEKLNSKQAHLVFTGGEPMLQQDGIMGLVNEFHNMKDQNGVICDPYCEIETNGTVPIKNEGMGYSLFDVTVSPKLANSGVLKKKRYRPEVLQDYIDTWGALNWKFVVFDEKDMKEIVKDFIVKLDVPSENIWLMPAGSTKLEVDSRANAVVELCKEYGFRYSPRLQVDLWGAQRGK